MGLRFAGTPRQRINSLAAISMPKAETTAAAGHCPAAAVLFSHYDRFSGSVHHLDDRRRGAAKEVGVTTIDRGDSMTGFGQR
jgi:hypothetical protein